MEELVLSDIYLLNSSCDSIKYLSSKDKRLKQVFEMIGDISYSPYSDDSYIFLLDTIVGQMLSNKVADIICKRVHDLCNNIVTPETISELSIEDLRSVGVSYSKVNYIQNLTNAILNGELILNDLTYEDDTTVFKKITSIRGLGSWSAKMYLIFVLNRQDILPYEDGAFLQSYMWLYNTTDIKPSSIKKKCKKWSPYSSIAARYLYKALDYGYTKEKFTLKKGENN